MKKKEIYLKPHSEVITVISEGMIANTINGSVSGFGEGIEMAKESEFLVDEDNP